MVVIRHINLKHKPRKPMIGKERSHSYGKAGYRGRNFSILRDLSIGRAGRNFLNLANQTKYTLNSTMMKKTIGAYGTNFPALTRIGGRGAYQDAQKTSLRRFGTANLNVTTRNFPKKRRINRIFRKMERISFLIDHQDHQETKLSRDACKTRGNPLRSGSAWTGAETKLDFGGNLRKTKLSLSKPDYSGKALEDLVNNEVSCYRNTDLTPKEAMILSSTRGTFLCSNYLRFQPLLNVFE